MVVLTDMDDVLTNFCEVWIQVLNDTYGTSVKHSDITDWKIQQFFPELTKEEVFAPLARTDIWDLMEPIEDSVDVLKTLQSEGHSLYIATSSNYKSIKEKIDKLVNKYFPFISHKGVIMLQNKQLLNGDFLIDDGMHNLMGGLYRKILFTQPHNQKYAVCSPFKESGFMSDTELKDFVSESDSEILRADNWVEVYRLINVLGGEKSGKSE